MPVTVLERRVWAVSALVFVAIQLTCTVLDRNYWPFCSYNMFNRRPAPTMGAWRVRLHEDGGAVVDARPAEVVPLEFFRANAAFSDVFGAPPDQGRRDAFARAILVMLDEQPWARFDETEASVRPSPGHHFVGLEVWYLRQPALSVAEVTSARQVHAYPASLRTASP